MKTTNARTKMTAEQRIAARKQRADRHRKQVKEAQQHMRDSRHPVYQDEEGFHHA